MRGRAAGCSRFIAGSMQYLPRQGIGHLAPLNYRHAVDQHILHPLRQLIGAFKGGSVMDRCRIEDHDIGPHPLLQYAAIGQPRSEEHTSELQSQSNLVCRLLLEKKKKNTNYKSSSEYSKHDTITHL